MPTDDRKLRVFLCHASQDKPLVRELYQQLQAEGWIDAWLDEKKLLPGQNWEMEIERAVETADAIVVCLSDTSVKKEGYIQKELRFALNVALEKPEETIFIIPLRIDECFVPRSIRSIQYIDYFPNNNKSLAYNRVRESLQIRATAIGVKPQSTSPKNSSGYSSSSISKEEKIKFTPGGHRIYTFGGIEFVKIPAGKFYMGGDRKKIKTLWTSQLSSLQEMDIPYDYWIGRFPITNEQWADHLDRIAYKYKSDFRKSMIAKSKLNHPTAGGNWKHAAEFTEVMNRHFLQQLPPGYVFNLPSEAEWEKAGRGTDQRLHPWGNEYDKNKCNMEPSGIKDTTSVGSYSPGGDSPYGAADMVGNVWEWTRTISENSPYKPPHGRIEINSLPATTSLIRRGSSWMGADDPPLLIRSGGTDGDVYIGMRVAIVPADVW